MAACRRACPPISTAASPGSPATAARSRSSTPRGPRSQTRSRRSRTWSRPTSHEVEGVLGGRIDEASHDDAPLEEVRDRAFASAEALLDRGARRALVTAGAHGAAFVAPGERLWVDAPRVELANPIGAGDALVGGLLVALDGGAAWPDAVRHAVTVASAAVEHPVAGRLDAARVAVLAGQERVGS